MYRMLAFVAGVVMLQPALAIEGDEQRHPFATPISQVVACASAESMADLAKRQMSLTNQPKNQPKTLEELAALGKGCTVFRNVQITSLAPAVGEEFSTIPRPNGKTGHVHMIVVYSGDEGAIYYVLAMNKEKLGGL